MGTIIKKRLTAVQTKRLKVRRKRSGFDPTKHAGVLEYKLDPVKVQRKLRDGE
ncbi:MAG: hypothetical protein IPJ76_13230 [Flavobacteriales bacterium]|nr:MAG: hypothetical protein IPJ76_13230 [Flavobacteriales bacterium]